jgi:hypothetical protein
LEQVTQRRFPPAWTVAEEKRRLLYREGSRAFAYCCLCARLGVILPGTPTIIDQIMMTRQEYEAAIRVGDDAAANGSRDFISHAIIS